MAPDSANAWYGLGLTYARLGRFQDTVACFRETVRLRPDLADAWDRLGMAYRETGDQQRAAESFRKARRLRAK